MNPRKKQFSQRNEVRTQNGKKSVAIRTVSTADIIIPEWDSWTWKRL